MSKNKIIILISSILVGLFLIIWAAMYTSTTNKEIDLRTSVEGQTKKCEAYFDKMWKILQQKAGVADQYKEAFKEIYPKMIEGRYSQGDGSLMKWITESNPTFDVGLYKDLMQSIEIERTGFYTEQEILIDLNREHSALLQKIPSKWFLGGIKEIAITVISSKATKETFKTGEENDVDLFKKK